MRRLLWIQGSLLIVISGSLFLIMNQPAGVAAVWGGLIAMVNSLLLARAVHRAGRAALRSSKAGMAHLYIGFVARFGIVLAGMGIGVMHMQLSPLPMIAGLGVVSLGAAFTERLT